MGVMFHLFSDEGSSTHIFKKVDLDLACVSQLYYDVKLFFFFFGDEHYDDIRSSFSASA